MALVHELLGKGAYGRVYRVTLAAPSGRPVGFAVKSVLATAPLKKESPAALAARRIEQRHEFLEEALLLQICGRLQAPCFPRYHGAGVTVPGGRLLLGMQAADGVSLQAYTTHATPGQLRHALFQLCWSLAVAQMHYRVQHRDISGNNILFTPVAYADVGAVSAFKAVGSGGVTYEWLLRHERDEQTPLLIDFGFGTLATGDGRDLHGFYRNLASVPAPEFFGGEVGDDTTVRRCEGDTWALAQVWLMALFNAAMPHAGEGDRKFLALGDWVGFCGTNDCGLLIDDFDTALRQVSPEHANLKATSYTSHQVAAHYYLALGLLQRALGNPVLPPRDLSASDNMILQQDASDSDASVDDGDEGTDTLEMAGFRALRQAGFERKVDLLAQWNPAMGNLLAAVEARLGADFVRVMRRLLDWPAPLVGTPSGEPLALLVLLEEPYFASLRANVQMDVEAVQRHDYYSKIHKLTRPVGPRHAQYVARLRRDMTLAAYKDKDTFCRAVGQQLVAAGAEHFSPHAPKKREAPLALDASTSDASEDISGQPALKRGRLDVCSEGIIQTKM